MLAAERQARIIQEIRRRGSARVSEFARLFGVSDMTIRRDLDLLAQQGLLDKVHGGATRRLPSTDEPGFRAKSLRQQAEKEAIGVAAAGLVEPGAAIGISAGTTTRALAGHLRDVPGLTVVTNSVRVADVFQSGHGTDRHIVLTGGIKTPSDALVGPIAVATLTGLHLDIAFLGVHGMSPDAGYTTPNLLEAETDRALLAAGRRVVVLADHTKWSVVGISTIAPLSAADVVISDEHLPAAARTRLEEVVTDVRLVQVATPSDG